MRLERNAQAAAKLFESVAHDPTNPKAVANKVLAFLLIENFEEAVAEARAELSRRPEHEIVAAYMIQAAAHIPGMSNPISELAPSVRGNADVQLADVVFSRNRRDDAWIAKAQEACRQHPAVEALSLFAAEADIAEISDAGSYQSTRLVSEDVQDTLVRAATRLDAEWQRIRSSECPDTLEASGVAEIAMIGWHLAQLPDEACALAEAIVAAKASSESAIMNAALILAESGRREVALKALERAPNTALARWLRGTSLIADGDWKGGVALFATGDVPDAERTLAETFIALVPLRDAGSVVDESAFRTLIKRASNDARSLVTIARVARRRGLTDIAQEAFAQALNLVCPDTHLSSRIMVAKYAADTDDHSTVIELLGAVIPFDKPSDELAWLADAHANEFPKRQRNVEFFEQLSPATRTTPEYAHAEASVLLAIGGRADGAIPILQRVRSACPADGIAILQLARAFQEKHDQAALSALISSVDVNGLEAQPLHQMGVAQLLREGARFEDALRLGYAAVRADPRDARVALGYVGLIFGDRSEKIIPPVEEVGADTFVRLEGPHGQKEEFVVDDGESFWGIEHRPLSHDMVKMVAGKRAGETVVVPKSFGADETWKVGEVKSKFLHVLHDAMEHFETRFRGFDGLTKVTLKGEDITPVLEAVRSRAEATQENAKLYTDKVLPLEWVARMCGGDVISFASYIRSLGFSIFTCVGTHEEREAGLERAAAHQGRGAVLDTYTAVVATGIGILPFLKEYFGTLYLSRSAIDVLDRMIAKARAELGQDTMSISWQNGEYVRRTATDADLQADIDWLTDLRTKLLANMTVEDVVLPNDLSAEAVSIVRKIGAGAFHPIYIGKQRDAVLLSDDAIYRKIASDIVGVPGIWLQPVLLQAARSKIFGFQEYQKALVGLAAHRHGHVSVASGSLQLAYDSDVDGTLGEFATLAGSLGGPMADLRSHCDVALGALNTLWNGDLADSLKRGKATSILLAALIRARPKDYAFAIGFLAAALERAPGFIEYVTAWVEGHFLDMDACTKAFLFWKDVFRRERAFRYLLLKPYRRPE
jgi:tetratricopeptide (TPR) repeat protein